MDDESKEMLRTLLVAQVLMLSRALHADNLEKGTNRLGGDYTREAVRLIAQKTPEVLRLLAETR